MLASIIYDNVGEGESHISYTWEAGEDRRREGKGAGEPRLKWT